MVKWLKFIRFHHNHQKNTNFTSHPHEVYHHTTLYLGPQKNLIQINDECWLHLKHIAVMDPAQLSEKHT